ncbi:hypothetical protein CI610_02489 [invertebrate metagenome]|uniref:Uncharacterized protein n=1 Tax=invertebrate metagenome TaxID=1711999 RepID=A0A2H9T5T2_9ZZZZ
MLSGAIRQGIIEDPADTCRIRPQCRCCASRQAGLHLIQIFQHPGTGPVHIGAVFKQDINVRRAKHGSTTYIHCPRHRHHGGGQRVGDLIFHQLRCLTGEVCFDNHLHVRQVGQCVHRRVSGNPYPGKQQRQRR